jgi:hypothetical protein
VERRAVIFTLEIRAALADRRLFILNSVVPLAIVAPVAAGAAPPAHAAMVFTLLFTFFGTFGHAIPLARDAERGLCGRLLLAGVAPTAFFGQRIAAHASIDALQLAPALLVIAVAFGVPAAALAPLAAATLLALLAANMLGACLGAAARSIGEAALFSAVTALLALHAAGVFRTPAPGSTAAALQALLPFSGMHAAFAAASRAPGTIAGAVDWGAFVAVVALWSLLVTLASPLLARALVRRAHA